MTSAIPSGTPQPLLGSPRLGPSGKYRLLTRLAIGGMAEIFTAEVNGAAGFAKTLVIKRILPHVAHDPEYVTLFLDEARTAARIAHPNVCQVFDLLEEEGQHLIVMEYLEGVSLLDLLSRVLEAAGGLEARIVAGIALQALDALQAVHELVDLDGELGRVVHRDVSPGNLFVTVEGTVKLLDFGIAKARWVKHRTQAGVLLGKCDYMSPEQARGAGGLDRRADLFSLGVVLHELLSGERLFRRINDHETLRAVLRDPIPPPSARAVRIPPELDAVLAVALERDREARFPTAIAMRQAIEAAMAPHGGIASARELGERMARMFGTDIAERRAQLAEARREAAGITRPRPTLPMRSPRPSPAALEAAGFEAAPTEPGAGTGAPSRGASAGGRAATVPPPVPAARAISSDGLAELGDEFGLGGPTVPGHLGRRRTTVPGRPAMRTSAAGSASVVPTPRERIGVRARGSAPPPVAAESVPAPVDGSPRRRGLPLTPPPEPATVTPGAAADGRRAEAPAEVAQAITLPAPVAPTPAVAPPIVAAPSPAVAPPVVIAPGRRVTRAKDLDAARARRRDLVVHTIVPLTLLILVLVGFALAFALADGGRLFVGPDGVISPTVAASPTAVSTTAASPTAAGPTAAGQPPSPAPARSAPDETIAVSPIREAPARGDKGTVSLSADAPATLYQGRRPVGVLPINLALAPGTYAFKVLSDAGVKRYLEIIVRPGRRKVVRLRGMHD